MGQNCDKRLGWDGESSEEGGKKLEGRIEKQRQAGTCELREADLVVVMKHSQPL